MRDTVDYERLDEYQQAFVRSEAANVRVLAPAGSGKTETLLWRCQKVHERAAESTRFLIVTFTRAARAELKMRLSSEEFGAAPVSVMTLNRYGWALIRRKYDAPLLEERVLRCAAPPDDRWTHVLVDEFQDISPLDLRLVKAIAEQSGAALTIVGDDDQAIYEWRGGAPTYLLEPEREFGREFKTFVLERNYRCPRNLVAAADRLIRHNRNRHPKRMQAHSKSNAEIVLLESPDSAVSVSAVMEQVERFRRDSSTGDRMALLSRKKAQLVPYQILLADEDIRFNAADDLKIFLSSAFDKLKRVLEIRARRDAEEITARQVVEDTIHVCRQVRPGDRDWRTVEQFKRELRRVQPSGFAEACEAVRALQRRFDLEADYAGALSSMFAAKTGEEAIRVIGSRFEALHQDFGRGATDIFFLGSPVLLPGRGRQTVRQRLPRALADT